MTVAVLIPWRPQPGRGRALPFVIQHYAEALRPTRVVLADDPDPDSFNRGRALNEAARGLTEDVLVLADADLLVDPQALREAVELVQADPSALVIPFSGVSYLTQRASEALVEAEDWRAWGPVHLEARWARKSTGGVNVVTREGFEFVGGFDPRFRGWGFEDAALSLVWETLRGSVRWLDGEAVHLWHARNQGQRPGLELENRAVCQAYEAAFGNPAAMLSVRQGGKFWESLDKLLPNRIEPEP